MRKLVVLVFVALGVLLLIPAAASASTPAGGSLATPLAGPSLGVFASTWATLEDMSSPTVSANDPASGRDDSDISVTITGTGFVDTPTVTLGTTPLTDVIFVGDTTLTATVPAGISPGIYPLTVVNPDGGTGSLPNAFTVTAVIPTVSAVDPLSGTNDIDTSVTITGTDFSPTATVTLGSTALTRVTWVDSSTLTATVPWGMGPGPYTLTVTNPDGGATLPDAFTVTQGLGQWNAGDLFGGSIEQLLMKPGDPDTLYATSYGVTGLFRSDDAGEHWALVTDQASANNNEFAVDPLHPDWLYVFANGLMRSQDEGDTWTTLTDNKWPDGRDIQFPQVYVSPYEDATHPQALFVSSSEAYGITLTGALGLIKSTDGGATWTIVPSLEGVSVQDVAFDPNVQGHMVLVTSDMKVYQSTDWGDTWTQVSTSGLTPSSLGLRGSITYNPDGSEVWIDSFATTGGIFKSAAGDLSSWQDVSQSPGEGSVCLAFTSPSSVYVPRSFSTDGGTSWNSFGPSPWYGQGWVMFDPTNARVCYIENDAVGVQKTTDGGTTWNSSVDGLTGLDCTSMAVSQTDPLRVYAACYGPLGIYGSDDGTSTWTFIPIAGAAQVRQVLADPFDSQRVYAGADYGFYTSTDGGDSWTGTGWNLPPSSPSGLFVTMAADPYQAGHLLASFGGGTYGIGPGWLYSSTDYGATWQAVDVNPPSGVQWIHSIVFDPETPGTVYLTTNGVYKSTDDGATWQRIDDLKKPDMASANDMTIATHPQHLLLVSANNGDYRSTDGGATWQQTRSDPGSFYLFADGDSTRLYAGGSSGLYFSSDEGDTWERAAGVIGQVPTTALGYADADGHTILYAATNGGSAGTTGGAMVGTRRAALATTTTQMVDAGIYRYVVVTSKVTLKLSGLRGSTLRLHKYVTAKGVVTPSVLAGGKVRLQVERWVRKWVTVKILLRTIGAKGGYSGWYKPAKKGSYRLRVTIAKSATHTSAATTWHTFKVK